MTSGAIVAIIMMVFLELTAPRRKRLQVPLDDDALPRLSEFLNGFAPKSGWNAASQDRLVLVGEETLSSLLSEEFDDLDEPLARRLVVAARSGRDPCKTSRTSLFCAVKEGREAQRSRGFPGSNVRNPI